MNDQIRRHLSQLEGHPGIELDDLKKNFRRLSFIWHPDRQPEEYRELTEEKMRKINEAYEFFEKHPDALQRITQEEEKKEYSIFSDSSNYEVTPLDCPRCDGSGHISVDVDALGRFVNETCPVCGGEKVILVDTRNSCGDCKGTGSRQHLHDSDREDWIDKEMRKRGWLERNINPIAYKRTWLRYQREVSDCPSCSGAGYFYYRKDLRKGERRSESPLDFLHELQGVEQRDQDRRKAKPA